MDTLLSFMDWLRSGWWKATRRRTVVGLDKARAEGKTLGPPHRFHLFRVQLSRRRQEKASLRERRGGRR